LKKKASVRGRHRLLRRTLLAVGMLTALFAASVPAAQAYDEYYYGSWNLQPGESRDVNTAIGASIFLPWTGTVAAYYGAGNTTVCAGALHRPEVDFRTCGVNYAGNAANLWNWRGIGMSLYIENGGATRHMIDGWAYTEYEMLSAGGSSYYKERLNAGQKLESDNRVFRFSLQADGNAVVYNNNTGAVCWHSNTNGNPGAYARMQSDGNFVVYSAGGAPLFNTGTHGNSYAWMHMQNDGNLVIYKSNTLTPIWATSMITGQAGC
jgi:hypothetical protein